MGANQAKNSELANLLVTQGVRNLDFNRLGELRKLVQGHESEIVALLATIAHTDRPTNLKDYPEYLQHVMKPLLPLVVQWLSKNELSSRMLAEIPVASLLREVHDFVVNPNGQNAAVKELVGNFTQNLITPPDVDAEKDL